MFVLDVSPHVAAHLAVAVKLHRERMRRDFHSVPAELAELERRWTELAKAGQEGTTDADAAVLEHDATDARLLVSFEEAARVMSVSEKTIQRLTRAGELDVVEVGSRRLVRRASIEAFIERGHSDERTQP